MSGDPFEHFEQQLRSHELITEHRDLLLAEAAEFVRQHPGTPPVALILEADTSEAAPLWAALQRASGHDLQGRGFLGVVPRAFALQILRANAPATLDWLAPATADGAELPLVVATRNGFRLGVLRRGDAAP
ncbi:MAG TPA: hypothetical protein VK348_03435 [Planctomycetota bacterium]|nr:hypothetical protein [Planctomycetota bacterium]